MSTINRNLRFSLAEYFPDLIFYDAPASDEAIAGLALVYDCGLTWVVAYDEYYLLGELEKEFADSEDPSLEAVEWYEYNIAGGYLGHTTPAFINFCENTARRFNMEYENVRVISDFDSIDDALTFVQNNEEGIVFVQLDQINCLENFV